MGLFSYLALPWSPGGLHSYYSRDGSIKKWWQSPCSFHEIVNKLFKNIHTCFNINLHKSCYPTPWGCRLFILKVSSVHMSFFGATCILGDIIAFKDYVFDAFKRQYRRSGMRKLTILSKSNSCWYFWNKRRKGIIVQLSIMESLSLRLNKFL